MAVGSRILGAAGVRADERATIGHVAGVFAMLELGRGLGEVGVNTLIGRLDASILPWLFIPLGFVSMGIAIGYGGALARVRRARLLAVLLASVSAILVTEWLALVAGVDAVPVAWITVMAAGTLAITVGWTVAGTSLDARQAKRLFPICTATAITGYLTGSLLAGPVTGLTGDASWLLLLQAVAFLVAAGIVIRLARRSDRSGWGPPTGRRSIVDGLRMGFDVVRQSPLLRLVAAAYVLLAILMFSVTFPYLSAVRAAYADEAERASVLGVVSAFVTVGSLIVALALANRFYARFGVAAAALMLPIVYLAGFGLWIVQFTFITAATVTVSQQVTQRGLSNAAWTAFYNVVPADRRAQALAFNDGVPGQVGTVLSGVLLLLAGTILAPDQIFWLGLIAAAACVVVVLAIRRRYADALLRTLRSGVGEQVLEGGPALGDLVEVPDVRRQLVHALAAPEPRVREMAAVMLARSPGPDTLDALLTALDDPDPSVQASAAQALVSHDEGHPEHVERADTMLRTMLDGERRARIAALRALRRLGRRPPDDDLDRLLADPVPGVRAASLETLDPSRDVDVLVAAMADGSRLVRHAAASTLAAGPVVPAGVVELLADPRLDIQEAAVVAMLGHGDEVREPVVVWAGAQVDRATQLTAASSALHPTVGDEAAFLAHVIERRRRAHQDLALGALAVLDVPEARGPIRRCLRSSDPDIRAQAIEALDSVGDRRLGGSIARLIEIDPASTRDGQERLASLRHDDDPWIRTLAGLVLDGGGDVTEPAASVGEIERMLELRRVPLFARLDPEDLLRVAAVAQERPFEAGEALVREGDIGDELFVILDGLVRVERAETDGSTRLLRRFGPGDHVGELAVLREQPRVATVVAETAVRTLAIEGDGLTAILRERPEAAMAMLTTLAERISDQ